MSEEENLARLKKGMNAHTATFVRSIARKFAKDLGFAGTVSVEDVVGWLNEYANEIENG